MFLKHISQLAFALLYVSDKHKTQLKEKKFKKKFKKASFIAEMQSRKENPNLCEIVPIIFFKVHILFSVTSLIISNQSLSKT